MALYTLELRKLREERTKIDEEQKALNDVVLTRGDGYTAEEKEKDEGMEVRWGELTDLIEKCERTEERREIVQSAEEVIAKTEENEEVSAPLEHRALVWKRDGRKGFSKEELKEEDGYMADFRKFLWDNNRRSLPAAGSSADSLPTDEFGRYTQRALQADLPVSGGYTVPPMQFIADLIQAVDNMLLIRQLSTVIPVVTSDSLGAPSLDADPADPIWTDEIGTGDEDSTMAFGGRELHPRPLAKRIKVSDKLLRTSALPIDQIVRDRLAYTLGNTMDAAFFTGNGATEPMGLFTAAAVANQGITTGRDTTAALTTTFTADEIIDTKYSCKAQYHGASSVFALHRNIVKYVRQLKTGDGQYLWKTGLATDPEDTLLGNRVIMSENAPSTQTAGDYQLLFGDLSFFWIAELLTPRIKVLNELYAETDQIGYISRHEADAMPVLEEAFARLILST